MESTSKLRKHLFHLVIITAAAAMIYGLPYFRSYFYDAYLETYHLTNTQMGTFGSIFGVMGAVSYLFGGVVADMISTRKLMSISLILTGLGGLLHLTNPSYIVLLLIYALWGVASLFAFWPSVVKSLREISNPDELSRAYGFFDSGRGIVYAIDGAAILAIFGYFSKVSGDKGGLNGVIIYYSAVTIVLGILVFILMKENGASKAQKEGSEGITVSQVVEVLKMPAVWILSAILCCAYVMNIAFYYFTPYATSRFGMAAAAGAVVTIAAQYVRPVACTCTGILADKIGRSKILYGTFSIMGICTFLMLVVGNMSSAMFVGLCLLIYVGMYGGYNMVWSMTDDGGIPLRVAGTAAGLISTIGYLPEVVVSYCYGKLLDKFGDDGYRYMFIAITVIMIIGIIMLVVWDRYLKKIKKNQEISAAANV